MSATIPARRVVGKFRFEVPSKSNYRYDSKDSEKWTRISRYQHEVGIEALRAGAGPNMRKHGKNPVGVEIVAIGQIADRGEMLSDDGRHARVRVTVVYFEGEE